MHLIEFMIFVIGLIAISECLVVADHKVTVKRLRTGNDDLLRVSQNLWKVIWGLRIFIAVIILGFCVYQWYSVYVTMSDAALYIRESK